MKDDVAVNPAFQVPIQYKFFKAQVLAGIREVLVVTAPKPTRNSEVKSRLTPINRIANEAKLEECAIAYRTQNCLVEIEFGMTKPIVLPQAVEILDNGLAATFWDVNEDCAFFENFG